MKEFNRSISELSKSDDSSEIYSLYKINFERWTGEWNDPSSNGSSNFYLIGYSC